MKKLILTFLLLPLLGLQAQDFNSAAKTTEGDLERALRELAQLRNKIAEEEIPLAVEINKLEDEKIVLIAKRNEVVELASGGRRIKAELEEKESDLIKQNDYIHTAMANYIGGFLKVAVNVSEQQLYEEAIGKANAVKDQVDIPLAERYKIQLDAVMTSFARIDEMIAGRSFSGEAKVAGDVYAQGDFAVIGPIAIFSSNGTSGLIENIKDEAVQTLIPNAPVAGMIDLTSNGNGVMFFDSKLGEALDILQLKESRLEHFKRGGVVMWPIGLLALAAALVSIFKIIEIARVKTSKPEDLDKILDFINAGDKEGAMNYAKNVKGPVGEMLSAALPHVGGGDDDLVEEMLYEKMLQTQPKLERLLPFIAVTAATAPLLGLLGTVTGMINTFKLITIFGTGDAAQLSGGISEALITTESGLIVAIPTLMIHALLTRMSKGVLSKMERTAVGFVNRLPDNSN